MKDKLSISDNEIKRILSLHKTKINEERNLKNFKGKNINERTQDGYVDPSGLGVVDPGQSTGRVFAGAAAGAGIGLLIGGPPGSVIGAGVGALIGAFTVSGGFYRKITSVFNFCANHKSNLGKPLNNDGTIRLIADKIYTAIKGLGTDEIKIAQAITSLKTIPDLCRLRTIYRERYNEPLLTALDGDIDQDREWRDYVWLPISDLVKNTKKIDSLAENAKKCGWGTDVEGYKNSGWRCPKGSGPLPPPKPPEPGPKPIIRKKYTFDFAQAEAALKSKCGGSGGGGEDEFVDDYRVTDGVKVDTKVNTNDLNKWK